MLPSLVAFALLLWVVRREGGLVAALVCGTTLMVWISAQSARMDVLFTLLLTAGALMLRRFFDADDRRALVIASVLTSALRSEAAANLHFKIRNNSRDTFFFRALEEDVIAPLVQQRIRGGWRGTLFVCVTGSRTFVLLPGETITLRASVPAQGLIRVGVPDPYTNRIAMASAYATRTSSQDYPRDDGRFRHLAPKAATEVTAVQRGRTAARRLTFVLHA